MDVSPVDGLLGSDIAEISYEDTIEIPDDGWWDSVFGTAHSNTTEDEALSAPTTTAFSCTAPLSNSVDHSQSSHPLSRPPFARAKISCHAIQSPTYPLTTFDAPLAPHLSWPSDPFSSPAFDISVPNDSLRAIGIVPLGHKSAPDNTTLPDRFHNVRCSLEQRPQAPVLAAETKSYDAQHGDFPFGLGEPYSQSGALRVNRAQYMISDNLAKPYVHAVDDHRDTHKRHPTYLNSNGMASVEQFSSLSPVWRDAHRLKALSASELISSHGLAPQVSPLASSSTILPTSATTSPLLDDNWQCDICGTVITTRGIKNRNRNKKRHRCPGTGPKYPCPVCPKSFNRGDSGLVHLRRWHPEMHTKPPRARKEKGLTEGSMN